jgi:hypothetical protein
MSRREGEGEKEKIIGVFVYVAACAIGREKEMK